MRRHALPSALASSTPAVIPRGFAADALWAVNQRLATVERELRIQFTRIAQLQAQLDVVLGALRRPVSGSRSPDVARRRDPVDLKLL